MKGLTVDYGRGDVHELLRRDSNILYIAEFATGASDVAADRPLRALGETVQYSLQPQLAAEQDPRHVQVELDPLHGAGLHEIWTTEGPIETGRVGPVWFAQSPRYLFAQLSFAHSSPAPDSAQAATSGRAVAVHQTADFGRRDSSGGARHLLPTLNSDALVAATEDAYLQLLQVARSRGHGHILRVWNYLRDINAGVGDRERYRLFCLGRSEALHKLGYDENLLPAATAIGMRSSRNELLVYLLAAREPGIAVENPRQVSAYRYPRRYGPRSPAFSRAMYVPQTDGTGTLLISGTASIVGHLSEHTGHLQKQTTETLANIDALVSDAVLQSGYLPPVSSAVLAKAYLRHDEDAKEFATALERWSGPDRYLLLAGDICRSDLLLEVEAIVPLSGAVTRAAAK